MIGIDCILVAVFSFLCRFCRDIVEERDKSDLRIACLCFPTPRATLAITIVEYMVCVVLHSLAILQICEISGKNDKWTRGAHAILKSV